VKPESKVKLNKFLLQPHLLPIPTTNKSDQPVTPHESAAIYAVYCSIISP